VSGSGGVVCSWFLLFTATIAVVRQKFHLSSCADFRGRLSARRNPVGGYTVSPGVSNAVCTKQPSVFQFTHRIPKFVFYGESVEIEAAVPASGDALGHAFWVAYPY